MELWLFKTKICLYFSQYFTICRFICMYLEIGSYSWIVHKLSGNCHNNVKGPMSKAKESYSKANTLSCIVGLCVGHVTTIELRNDAHVTGKIISVDGFMNVTFEKSLFCDPAGNRRKFDNFFVQNRLIRYVQIPVTIDLRSSLEKAVTSTNMVKKHNPEISLHRKAILRKREQRRMEDLANASKLMK